MRKGLEGILAGLGAGAPAGPVSPESLAELKQLLDASEPALRKRVAQVIAELERAAAAAAPLAPLVDEPDAAREAVWALARRGPAARAELPTLIKILDDGDDELRSHAAEAIGAVAPGAAELLPRLLPGLLQQPRVDLRARRWARGVAGLGDAAAPALLEALATGSPLERALAVTASCVLFTAKPQADALPQLLRAVGDEELGEARAYAVAALGAMVGSSEDALQTLAALLRDRDVRVAREAVVALARSGAPGLAELRRAWALKPRPPVLKQLGWVLDAPAGAAPLWTFLCAADGPEIDAGVRARLKHCLAERRSTPVALMHGFVRDRDRETRLSLAGNRRAPGEILAALAKDRDDEVRRLVADNPATPAALLVALAADRSDEVKLTLAENPSTPAEALELLVKERIPKIQRLVARHRNTALPRLEALARHKQPLVRCAVAGNPNLPFALLEQLCQEEGLELTTAVALHPRAPLPVLEALVRHRERDVRAALARNPELPEALFRVLAQDPSAAVKLGLAENPRTPPAILAALASSGSEKLRDALVDNPGTSSSALAILARSEAVAIRLAVLGHANVSDEVVARLAEDVDPRVRATAIMKTDPRRSSWQECEHSWAEFVDSPL